MSMIWAREKGFAKGKQASDTSKISSSSELPDATHLRKVLLPALMLPSRQRVTLPAARLELAPPLSAVSSSTFCLMSLAMMEQWCLRMPTSSCSPAACLSSIRENRSNAEKTLQMRRAVCVSRSSGHSLNEDIHRQNSYEPSQRQQATRIFRVRRTLEKAGVWHMKEHVDEKMQVMHQCVIRYVQDFKQPASVPSTAHMLEPYHCQLQHGCNMSDAVDT